MINREQVNIATGRAMLNPIAAEAIGPMRRVTPMGISIWLIRGAASFVAELSSIVELKILGGAFGGSNDQKNGRLPMKLNCKGAVLVFAKLLRKEVFAP